MNKLIVSSLAVIVVALSSGCGEPQGCDFREGSLNGPEDRCQERGGFQSFGFKEACGLAGGEALEGACPTEGIVSGCDLGQGVSDWYYEPISLEEAEGNCGSGEPILEAP